MKIDIIFSLVSCFNARTPHSNLPDIRLHDLRHSNATALIQAGVNPRVVQQRLGHSDVSITLNTYTHVLPDMDKDAAAKLDDVLLKKA